MDDGLLKLIRNYQEKVSQAVDMLEAVGFQRPASDMAWSSCGGPFSGTLPNGAIYFKHGFGCAIAGPEWCVDFDFGEAGEFDGFRASRLYSFAQERLAEYDFRSEQEIRSAIEQATTNGEVRFSGYLLYYLNEGQDSED